MILKYVFDKMAMISVKWKHKSPHCCYYGVLNPLQRYGWGFLSLKVNIFMNCGSTHVMSGKQSSGQWLSMWWMVLGSACGSFTRDWFLNPSWVGSFQLCRFLLSSAAVATVVDADLWDLLRTALTNDERIHSDAKICLKALYSRELHFWIWFLKHLQ